MRIIKRSGAQQDYCSAKIISAMQKAFYSVATPCTEAELTALCKQVEDSLGGGIIDVERIQDAVEQVLMQSGNYAVAKSYILYREKRAQLRKSRAQLCEALPQVGLADCLLDIQKSFAEEEYSLARLHAKFSSFEKQAMTADEQLGALIKAAVELTTQEAPQWEYIAARLLYVRFALRLQKEIEKYNFTSFYDKLVYLTGEGLYGDYILAGYSKSEVDACEAMIDNSRNHLFTYAGLDLLLNRYIIKSHRHEPLESPQEMYLGIAMHLALRETNDRLGWVKRFYDMLSLMQVTMATPTLSNARKPYHQLSSCFIDTVPDSLDGIYHSVNSFAQVSKFGGGMGMYFGKVRATGGTIRGFQGAAGGVIRWIKIVNDTAVAVDQLGMRQGAVAVYLDAWHKDLPEFLQLRVNNGDDRMRAHDIFPAVCYPDLFWKMAGENLDQNWYLLCPHDVLTVKGYSLEDFYGEEWEKRYLDCVADARIEKRTVLLKDIMRLILKSAVETGTPFAFYRDAVNRANPNGHQGIIYCSNLCTEIAQNMSATNLVSQKIETQDGETVVVTTAKPGDFVVCNLASLCLGNIDVDKPEEIDRITAIAVRALDNVIDLNFYPVPYAELTNHRYRSIGLGISGYHHMLAKHAVQWESEAHLQLADRVFEQINYAAIKASCALAKEKGSYDFFEGSDWQTGAYFEKRGYQDARWQALAAEVAQNGMRNAYLIAVAPTSSTSILVGTTAGLDPVMHRYFLEEKKGMILPRVAPQLGPDTYWYYKNAHYIDQSWTVRAAGVRQRHIDQAQSFNLYITNEFTLRQVMDLYLLACQCGVKTIYYVRSKALEVDECESCSS